MTITSFTPGLLLIACHYLGFASDAQEQIKRIDVAKLPVESATAGDFVPKGWEIEEEINGDLNGDSIPDVVIKLVEEKPPDFDESDPPIRRRALLILFKLPDGRLRREAFADKVLLYQCQCHGSCYKQDIEIANGVIIISQCEGGTIITAETDRFKFDSRTKRFALIGMDYDFWNMRDDWGYSESTNFFTRIKITTVKRYNEKKNTDVIVSKKRGRIVTKKRFIEDVETRSL